MLAVTRGPHASDRLLGQAAGASGRRMGVSGHRIGARGVGSL